MPTIRVLIADDHPVYRRGLRELLEESSFEVVSEAREGAEAVDQAVRYRPDVALVDIHLPGMDGIEAARRIKERSPKTSVVIVSVADDEGHIREAIEAGVSGYVPKDEEPESLVEAIRAAAEGKGYLPPLIATRVLSALSGSGANYFWGSAKGATPLSSREFAVLRLMAQGERNREIAQALSISPRTVGNHITSIYNKLAIHDRSQAIVYAIKKGIVRI